VDFDHAARRIGNELFEWYRIVILRTRRRQYERERLSVLCVFKLINIRR